MLIPVQQKVKKLEQQLGLSQNLALLDRAWEAEVGRLADQARIVALDRLPTGQAGAALVVEADSSPAMQEISLRRRELVRRLNQHFPDDFVKQITVRMAERG